MLKAEVRITEALTIEILTTDALTIEIRITEVLKIRVLITEAPEMDVRRAVQEAVLRITEEETDAPREVIRAEARTENAARVKEDRADVPREALTAGTAITVLPRTEPRRAADRAAIPRGTPSRAIIPREEIRIPNVLPRGVLTDRAEEALIMEDRPTTGRMALRDLQDLALTVIRVTAAVEAAARAVAAASAVTAAITEAMAGREIDSEVSQRLKALWQRLRPRIWKRSVRKKRDASVRKRISATGRT